MKNFASFTAVTLALQLQTCRTEYRRLMRYKIQFPISGRYARLATCIFLQMVLGVVGYAFAQGASAATSGEADAKAPHAQNMFNSGAAGDISHQMSMMWAIFGRGENVQLTPFGNEPGWYEWMARKHCWSDTPKYREVLHSYLVNWPQAKDGYIWTWQTEEGWPTHHVRHNENNAKYILAAWRYYCWQGGSAFLQELDSTTTKSARPEQSDVSNGCTVLQKLRAAMDYQLTTLDGQSGLAIITDPACDGTVDGMPSDYWDNFRFGYKSAYTNIYFYASLLAMADLEASLGDAKRATELMALSKRVQENYSKTFWDVKNGRFIGCVDRTGRTWDFGFTYLNLEAIAYGLASDQQAAQIFEWLDGKRIIADDKQKVGNRMTGATGAEIYALQWAPLATTRAVESIKVDGKYWWWHLGNQITADNNASYGEHLENGGAIFYVSHYDMMARLRTYGPDNAWQRFEGILNEFRKDELKRDPENNKGAAWKWGIIGEFPESGLVPATIALGFMGLNASPDALVVNPRLPQALPWMEVQHVHYRGATYSVRADKERIRIKALSQSTGSGKVICDHQTAVLLPRQGEEITISRIKH